MAQTCDEDEDQTSLLLQQEDALEDVHTRFILNLPDEELLSADRIFFQLEQAWWFYDDFYCDANPSLERYSSLKPFAKKMFAVSPLLCQRLGEFDALWAEFMSYKTAISTYGTVLLNKDCTKIVLCQNYKGTSWTIPSGKVNQGETGIQAGARETYEETGFDPEGQRGVAKQLKLAAQEKAMEQGIPWEDGTSNDSFGKFLGWNTLRESDKLVYVEEGTGKQRTCYICRGVPETFPFEPVARKEVSLISWHDLGNLPKKTYSVLPFLRDLKRWIKKQQIDPGILSYPCRSSSISDDESAFKELQPFFSENGLSPWDTVTATHNAKDEIATNSGSMKVNKSLVERVDLHDGNTEDINSAEPVRVSASREKNLSKTEIVVNEELYPSSYAPNSSLIETTQEDTCFNEFESVQLCNIIEATQVGNIADNDDDFEWMKRWVEGLKPRVQSAPTLFKLEISSVMEALYG